MNFEDKPLRQWFQDFHRDFPWRTMRTPYAIWVSEMMLQQTQATVVVPYFLRWMQLFPNIESLANAPLDTVIKAWEGLGYYSRARYLHEGARYILKAHGGIFPSSPEDLKKIKGLGPYTIGAIRNFAFHQKVPAVDGNVLRVIARYFMLTDDIALPKTKKAIELIVGQILPDHEPWVISEALIELGATICNRKPNCQICPLKKSCQAYASGTVESLPYKSPKQKTTALFRAVALIKHGDLFLVRRGQKGEIMSDLYEFPYFETTEKGIATTELKQKIFERFQCTSEWQNNLTEISQAFTRYRVRLRPAVLACSTFFNPREHHHWFSLSELSQLAFSSGHRRILQALMNEEKHSN